MGADRDAPRAGDHLKMDARTGAQRARGLDESATRAEIHERNGTAGSQCRAEIGAGWRRKAPIVTAVFHLVIQRTAPVS